MTAVEPWTDVDQQKALWQGWGLFDNSAEGLCIQRYDDLLRFANDGEARLFVLHRALHGDPLARKALAYLAANAASAAPP